MNKTVGFRSKYRYKKPKITGPCAPLRIIRTLTMAGNIEQRPWTPTVRTRRIAAETSNPGPAIVQLPTLIGSKVPDSKKKGAPAYSFGHKPATKDETTGPGPAQYNVSGMVPRGKECPHAATLQSRPKELTRFVNPGPGEYDVMNASKAVIDATPKYTFGKRPPHTKYQLIPAPNVYKIPTVLGSSKEGQIRSAPAYTMAGRMRPSLIPKLVLPGPGYYDGEYTVTKSKPPVYSMRGKFNVITDNNKPGPGAHCPEKYWEKRSTPSISFGIMHSRFCGRPTQCLVPDRFVNCLLANRVDRNYA